ncbi:discoidin domain-containing protein [Novosphingobium mangrovi (ex Huang et al. 2023)]|uniref:Discoidin domain-containing protein n=1 Tax=Novosphingobium mangrovi (ex Huang et al. 2023) TaxID=2976432 RepID=A0ABT2I158_9SPHN|nr:discoidin domain-containing protein [Novosphingobium mangrovi (ex Huang et al. 2023)]MCT2398537.1 discoidin domain-containing protein [Novosphingobium mangrovi (ex Huang et al. 2023)]
MLPFRAPLFARPQASSPGGGFGSHAYWRVFCEDNWGDATGIVIAEVEFLDGSGSVIAATGGTAIGSDDSATNEFSKAFDGGGGGSWFADSGPTNQWIGYHYPSTEPVEKVRLTMVASGTNFLTRMPKNCRLEYSDDGSSWTTAITFINVSLKGAQFTYPESVAPGAYKIWKALVPSVNSGTLTVCKEFEWRSVVSGADQTPVFTDNFGTSAGRVIYSSQAAGADAYKAFTDSTSDQWIGNSGSNEYLGVIFATALDMAEIAWTCHDSGSYAPASIEIYGSHDGDTWDLIDTLTPGTWTGGETKQLALAA